MKIWSWFFDPSARFFDRSMRSLVIVDLGCIVSVAVFCSPKALLVCMGAAGIGAFFGFLFGIPRVQRIVLPVGADGKDRLDDSGGGIRHNSNFQAISDWLTMGITVLALTNLRQILDRLVVIGDKLSEAKIFCEVPAVGIVMILLGALVLGFVHTFLWAYTEFKSGLQELEQAMERADVAEREQQRERRNMQFALHVANLRSDVLAKQRVAEKPSAQDQQGPETGNASVYADSRFGVPKAIWDSDPIRDAAPYKLFSIDSDNKITLDARVEPAGLAYRVLATVRRADGRRFSPDDCCEFLLHPTFELLGEQKTDQPFVWKMPPGGGGRFTLLIPAIGAFWIGARVKGSVRGEVRVDLADAPGADERFRSK